MALHPPHEKEQIKAIDITLATAPKIQEDLKRLKSGYDFKTLKEADRDPTQED